MKGNKFGDQISIHPSLILIQELLYKISPIQVRGVVIDRPGLHDFTFVKQKQSILQMLK